jgi:ankyrin repeat protein
LLEASAGGHWQVVERLIASHANINVVAMVVTQAGNVVHLTALILACLQNHIQVVRCLLRHAVDPNFKPQGSFPALLCAAKAGHVEIILELKAHGADMNIVNSVGSTALHLAVQGGFGRLIAELLKAGCNPAIKDNHNRTPLQLAQALNFVEAISLLSPTQA